MSGKVPDSTAAAEEAVDEYLRRVDAGEDVDCDAFIAAHPNCAEELRSFFNGAELFERLAKRSALESSAETVVVASGVEPIAQAGSEPWSKLPTTFGRYRVDKCLGHGAMGAVYRAHDSQLDRPVALKIPKLTKAASSDMQQRLVREARAAAILKHPNLCRVYDVDQTDGTWFIAMELVEGRPLSNYIRSGKPPSLRIAATLVRKMALAMQVAHDQGVIHRDLKPSNILIDQHGEPIVMDFGLSFRPVQSGQERLTQDGTLVGSPAYMSPEQARADSKAIGPASDIYGLGVIFYELLTGQLPFTGSVLAILAKVLSEPPTPVNTLRPEIGDDLAAICHRMLAKQPSERFASMNDVANALAKWLKKAAAPRPAGSEKTPTATDQSASPESNDGLIITAKRSLKAHDYEQAAQLLEQIPYSQHTDETAALLHKAQDLRDEVMWLIADMDQAVGLHQLEELPVTLKRLLQLKPGHKRAKELLARLESYGKADDVRYRYSSEGDLLPARSEDGVFSGFSRSLALTLSLALAVFAAVTWFTWSYLSRSHTDPTVPQLNTESQPASRLPTAASEAKKSAPAIPGAKLPADRTTGVAAATETDPDRAVAAWSLSINGVVDIDVAGNAQVLSGPDTKLPSQPLKVIKLHFGEKGPTTLKDADLQQLTALKSLSVLGIANAPAVSDEGVRPLKSLTSLESVSLYATNVGDDSVRILAGLPKLNTIQLNETKVTDAGVAQLSQLPNLRYLAVGPLISDEGVKALSMNKELLSLTLRSPTITDRGFALLEGHPALDQLFIGHLSQVTPDALSVLRTLPKLTGIDIHGRMLTEIGVSHLAAISTLKSLTIIQQATGQQLASLKAIQSLEHLGIQNTNMTDADFTLLPEINGLTSLRILGAKITDESVEPLARRRGLMSLELWRTGITEAGIARLKQLAPNLNVIAEVSAPSASTVTPAAASQPVK